MNCKIGTAEWIGLIFATLILDVIQVILDFFVIGLVLNRIIDIVVGFLLPIYFWLRKVNMNDWKNWLAFIGGFGLEEMGIGGDDGLPLWTLEVIVVWITVTAQKRLQKSLQKHPIIGKTVTNLTQNSNMPLNQNGVRAPRPKSLPANKNGVRNPQ